MKYGICNTKYAPRDTQYQFETIYICRGCSTNQPFYTKQTQSQGRSNECKLFSDKIIYENGQLVKSENKTNSNPILHQLRNPFFSAFFTHYWIYQFVYRSALSFDSAKMAQKLTLTNPRSETL